MSDCPGADGGHFLEGFNSLGIAYMFNKVKFEANGPYRGLNETLVQVEMPTDYTSSAVQFEWP